MGNSTLPKVPGSPVLTKATPEQYNALVNAFTGNQVMRDPTTGVETDGVYDIGDVSNGRPKDVNITGDVIKNGQIIGVGVPVGSIIAWHKSMSGVPALLDNFHECDGSVISDSRSLMNGQTLPDLNSTARFIRGGIASGTTQASQNKSEVLGVNLYLNGGSGGGFQQCSKFSVGPSGSTPNIMASLAGSDNLTTVMLETVSNGNSESRPDNMSMVWIMRIF